MIEKMTTGEALAELRAVGYDAREWSKGGLTTIYLDGSKADRIWAGRWDHLVSADDVWLAVHRAVAGLRCEQCGAPANARRCRYHRDTEAAPTLNVVAITREVVLEPKKPRKPLPPGLSWTKVMFRRGAR